jgi:hypothetical protein
MLSSQDEQEERRRVALQDADLRRRQQQAQGGTFFAHGVAQANELSGGRFGATGVPTVTGATPVPNYPTAGAHQSDPVGTEPPLGFSVDQVEPIESSAVSLLSAEDTGAPAGAISSSENLPLVQDESSDAGAPSSPTEGSK